jgi:hypothetical protein
VAVHDDADGAHRRHLLLLEPPQEPVLALGEPRRQLLQREDVKLVLDEADDVAVDAALDLDDELGAPVGERGRPRQPEEVRVAGARDEPECAVLLEGSP